jgi:hypothetical protein
MQSSDLFLAFFIILIFIGIYFANMLTIGISNIKKNWPVYRCNPMVMPFASMFGHNPVQNFMYCVQNTQSSYMDYLLSPTHYAMNVFHEIINKTMTDINWVRKKFSSLSFNLTSIIGSIFSIFVNIMIEFQKIIIKLRDVFGKTIGILSSMIYIVDGGMKTGESVMAGPIGKTLRFVCFHPDTPVKLKNGISKKMKQIQLGDVLKNGSVVQATMNIMGNKNNDNTNDYYSIMSNELNTAILVTGSHLIYEPDLRRFIPVALYKYAKHMPHLRTETMSCLITDNHYIPVGEYTFWDWEDDGVYNKL